MTSWAELRGGLLALAAFIALILLLISWTPGIPGELLLQSLRLHVAAAGIVLTICLFAVGARWRSGLFLLLVLLAAAHAAYLIAELHGRRDALPGAPVATLSVLSFNVLTGNPFAAEAAQHIVDLQPDVAIIMETPGISSHLAELEKVLPYHLGCDDWRNCDISVWSRHPVLDKQMVLLPPFNRQRLAIVRIDVDGTPMTIVGTHWSKPYFDEASWFESAFVTDRLNALDGPILLSGDFNAAPWSDTMTSLRRDANLVPPPSHPATWPVVAGALGVPIDNMFTRGAARIDSIEAGADSFGSNHRYLLARVSLYATP